MKNSKSLLSVLMVLVIIMVSVAPTFAVVAPEDAAPIVQPYNKINEFLAEKMASVSDDELIPVWVWMTDIDVDKLEQDIEIQTGLTYQKIIDAKAELSANKAISSNNIVSKADGEISSLASFDKNVDTYLNATKAKRLRIAEDTEAYFDAKKSLATAMYTSANTTKISQLGIAESKVNFKSRLTPTFVAYLTKDEITETAESDNVLEVGYFDEYDQELEVPQQTQNSESDEEQTELPTLDVSTLHTGVKEAIRHDEALQKYGVTGAGIKVLHVDFGYVRSDKVNFDFIPNPDNIHNLIDEELYEVTDVSNIPIPELPETGKINVSHANTSVSYLQAFAKDVEIYSVAKPSAYDAYNEEHNTSINTLNDVEFAITDIHVDLISSSCNDGWEEYAISFSARWYDAIVSTYNIPLISSAGNNNNSERHSYDFPIAPANGYNSIGVGVYRYRTNAMENDYTYTQSTTDQTRVTYKPDLVVAMDSYSIGTKSYFGATSAGAPVVSAIVAMMMELDPSLKGQPEIIKSILMASCHEKANSSPLDQAINYQENMEDGLTPKQGAGKVDVLRALNIVAFGTYGYVTIAPTANYVYAPSIYLNSDVYGDSNEIYPLNVSISWLRENVANSNVENDNDITLGTKHEINLKVSYTNQNADDVKVSETVNSGKQLVFYENPVLDKDYRIRIYRGENDVNNNEGVLVGYAYSVGNFEKMLENVEIVGSTAVGETLTANAYTNDGLHAEDEGIDYLWYSSTNGTSWQTISGEYTSTYTITSSDLGKYFRCIVMQDYLNLPEIDVRTATKVVRYGDVDGDGSVNVMDITAIERYIENIATLSEEQKIAADLDGNKAVNSNDTYILRQYLMGVLDHFPVED